MEGHCRSPCSQRDLQVLSSAALAEVLRGKWRCWNMGENGHTEMHIYRGALVVLSRLPQTGTQHHNTALKCCPVVSQNTYGISNLSKPGSNLCLFRGFCLRKRHWHREAQGPRGCKAVQLCLSATTPTKSTAFHLKKNPTIS